MYNYTKLDKICEGNYATVYKAKDQRDGKIVALKKIRFESEDEGVPQTVIREIALLRQLHHKNIVRLEEVKIESIKSVYLVFEFVPMDLKKYLDSIPKHEKLDT
ncbi:hypothetical protein HPB48_012301 [Haemaphysalis longicornis]|uniref:Protein kinase domain-containing protein n=1 Tax=Haemaphysalis longicornis TaxID=44386 RepID=A0A9J6FRS8_HAELO|nr:hypothetical protein HPB48_012301 [Haemaphysalis longicornis]